MSINYSRVRKLKAYMEALPEKRITLNTYAKFPTRRQNPIAAERGATCGTMGCVAGWAVMLFDKGSQLVPKAWSNNAQLKDSDGNLIYFSDKAAQLLGLNPNSALADFLFSSLFGTHKSDKAEAVDRLQRILDTENKEGY